MKMAESSSNRQKNTVGIGEIARYEQFLHFPLCFQKTFTSDRYKPGLLWEGVKFLRTVIDVKLTFVLPVDVSSTMNTKSYKTYYR